MTVGFDFSLSLAVFEKTFFNIRRHSAVDSRRCSFVFFQFAFCFCYRHFYFGYRLLIILESTDFHFTFNMLENLQIGAIFGISSLFVFFPKWLVFLHKEGFLTFQGRGLQ